MSWSATQYSRFEDERNRPIRDLLARIPTQPVRRAVDAGCGPGNSTELLRARYQGAIVTGFDSSADMIAAACKRLPDLRFTVEDLTAWADEDGFDVILANAVIQWIPDHETLLPKLFARLAAGGSLAIQFPDNLNEPAHRLMREVATAGSWPIPEDRTEIQSAEWYYRVLRGCGAAVDIWRTTYYHPLAGAPAIVEWFKGTGLRPFLNPLNDEERAAFLRLYQSRIAEAYPAQEDGTVLLPFPRLFFIAVK